MRGALLLALVLSSGCGHAFRGWDRVDTAASATFALEAAVDYRQSRDIVADCREVNPVVGPCGDRMPVGLYLLSTVVVEVAVAAVLPPKWRRAWEGLAVGAEGHTVWVNASNGYWPMRTSVLEGESK